MPDLPDDRPDALIERVASELRRPVSFGPGFDQRVMAAVRQQPTVSGQSWSWLTRSRTVRLSPLGTLALAASFAALVVLATLQWSRTGNQTAIAPQPITQTIQFVLVAPKASTVSLVGDFNDWDPSTTRLLSGAGGVWSITVPLRPGRYQYAFLIDGNRWVADPAAPPAVGADDFGSPNSVLTVEPLSSL